MEKLRIFLIPASMVVVSLWTSGPTFGQVNNGLEFSAGADVYYGYDFSQPDDNSRQYVTQAARHNEFNLNWGFIKASYSEEWIRANLALHTGTYVSYNYAPEPDNVLKMIAEGNAGIRLIKGLWLDAGIMPSHIGYESTFSYNNELYTHALMSETTPYYSTGVQLSAEISDKTVLNFVVLNGWQNIVETNNAKSVGFRVNHRPVPDLELNYCNYYGNESTDPDDQVMRFFNCFYTKYSLTDKSHIVAMVDYGIQEKNNSEENGSIFAALAIFEYDPAPKINLAGRFEYYFDKNEFLVVTGVEGGFVNTNLAFCLSYLPTPFSKLRLETRYYTSPDEIYWAGPEDKTQSLLIVGSLAVNLTGLR